MDPWALLYQAELAEYQDNSLWSKNGIRPYVDAHGRLIEAHHPWTCGFCNQIKKFGCLQQSESHLSQRGHCNQIFWEYGYERPALPKWQCCREAVHARAPVIQPAPSPPTSMIQIESCRLRLINATAGGSAADAALAVNLTREMATTAMQAATSCEPLPAHSWDTPGLRAPPFLPRVDFGHPTGCPRAPPAYNVAPQSPRAKAESGPRSESPCVPTPAVTNTSAPASPPRSAPWPPWVGMSRVLAAPFPPPQAALRPVGAGGQPQSRPWTSPKSPPPVPPLSRASNDGPPATQVPASRWGVAPAVVPSHSVASARAARSCGAAAVSGEGVLEGEEGSESSEW